METWEGGFIRRDRRGAPVFVLYKQVAGRRWKRTLAARTLLDALVELRRFEADPADYCHPEDAPDARLVLDGALVDAYLASIQNTPKWRAYKRRLLLWWAATLNGCDLRRVRLAKHVLPALAAPPPLFRVVTSRPRLPSGHRERGNAVPPADTHATPWPGRGSLGAQRRDREEGGYRAAAAVTSQITARRCFPPKTRCSLLAQALLFFWPNQAPRKHGAFAHGEDSYMTISKWVSAGLAIFALTAGSAVASDAAQDRGAAAVQANGHKHAVQANDHEHCKMDCCKKAHAQTKPAEFTDFG